MVELGVAGAFTPTGMNEDSFIPDLRGYRAIRKYREMRDNDPIIGAILLAMDMMIRGVDWKVHPAEVAGGDEAAEFIESVLGDMSHSFDEHISEALSMLAFGFSFFETVFKRRDGPDQRDASRRSRYNDGLIGIRKLAPRAQWTIDRFMLDDKGGVKGIVQNASTQMQPVEIPIEKGLLYRTVSSNNAPSGRALSLDTPIPTPDGWRTMEDLQVGDKVFDDAGRVSYVLATANWSNRPCYEITFNSGETIVADENHEWVVQTNNDRRSGKSRKITTGELARTRLTLGKPGSWQGRTARFSIPWAGALDYVEQHLPVAPYYFGLWLGDGNKNNAAITCHVDDVAETVALVEGCGYSVDVVQNGRDDSNGRLLRVRSEQKWASDGPVQALRGLGVLNNKHIPACYLRGSLDQRRALLQGLMDSDGHINNGSCEFTNTNYALSSGVCELVRSLGIGCNITHKLNDHGNDCWKVHFTPDFPCFRLSRKADKVKTVRARKQHYIRSIRAVDARETKCIEVSSPSHLFLAGMSMIPTHNSLLRNAYTSYYYASHIETIESISIERELNGLPLGRIPAEFLAPNATEAQRAFVSEFKKILRDVKNNEQGFVLIPSDLYENEDGSKTNKHLVEFELVASNGSRDIDPSKVIIRHQQNMARTVLADFIMLGQNDRGSFALSKSKTDLFLRSMQGYLNNIAGVINKHLFPRLWMMNGFDLATMPSIQPGRVAPVDLEELGTFIQRVANAGAPLFPDEDLDNALRDAAGLPEAEHGEDMALAVSGEDTDDDDQES